MISIEPRRDVSSSIRFSAADPSVIVDSERDTRTQRSESEKRSRKPKSASRLLCRFVVGLVLVVLACIEEVVLL